MILSTFSQSLQKLELVNGVLFTGGWAKEGLYFETVKTIFKVYQYIIFVIIIIITCKDSLCASEASQVQNMNRMGGRVVVDDL
jgi:hypothetical protein